MQHPVHLVGGVFVVVLAFIGAIRGVLVIILRDFPLYASGNLELGEYRRKNERQDAKAAKIGGKRGVNVGRSGRTDCLNRQLES